MRLENILASYNAHAKSVTKRAKKDYNEAYDSLINQPNDSPCVINDLQSWAASLSSGVFDQDRDIIDRVRQTWGLTERDNVQVFVVPAGQLRRMPITSFITRPTTSPRLQQITLSISMSMNRITELEMGLCDPSLTEEERARMITGLEGNLSRYERAASRERARLAVAPRSGVIVVER